jgi:hypothetical protein
MKVSKSVLLHMQAKLRRQLNKDIRKLTHFHGTPFLVSSRNGFAMVEKSLINLPIHFLECRLPLLL